MPLRVADEAIIPHVYFFEGHFRTQFTIAAKQNAEFFRAYLVQKLSVSFVNVNNWKAFIPISNLWDSGIYSYASVFHHERVAERY